MAYVISAPTQQNSFFVQKKGVGLVLPLTTKFETTYSYEHQLIYNLKNLIMTRRGERVFQPLFGTKIYELLFEGITDKNLNAVKQDITQSIDFWLPQVEIRDISVLPIQNYSIVQIILKIGFNGKIINEPLTFNFQIQQ